MKKFIENIKNITNEVDIRNIKSEDLLKLLLNINKTNENIKNINLKNQKNKNSPDHFSIEKNLYCILINLISSLMDNDKNRQIRIVEILEIIDSTQEESAKDRSQFFIKLSYHIFTKLSHLIPHDLFIEYLKDFYLYLELVS